MDKLICLVGASGSGKTTLAKELEKLGYNIIHSYTTRKSREKGEWGHTFIKEYCPVYVDDTFTGMVDPKGPDFKYIDIDEMIAYFNDYKEEGHYFATYEQYQGKGTSVYIVDAFGAYQVKENVKDAEVITIFLMADERIRSIRLYEREYENRNIPHYINKEYFNKLENDRFEIRNNVENRIRKDREIFKTCKCDYVVDANREVEKVLEDVVEIIC